MKRMIVIALLVGLIYTLPNLFGQAPAVQVSSSKATVRITRDTATRVEQALKEAKLNADALTGHLSTALCHLGNIATRLGRSLRFDPEKEQILGDDEANALVRREYREHWGTPKGA